MEGFPLLGFSGILPEGLSGPAPTGGFLSCAGISPSLPPPLGEGRERAERGSPYFPPQGILIPSSPMLLTGDSYRGSR